MTLYSSICLLFSFIIRKKICNKDQHNIVNQLYFKKKKTQLILIFIAFVFANSPTPHLLVTPALQSTLEVFSLSFVDIQRSRVANI